MPVPFRVPPPCAEGGVDPHRNEIPNRRGQHPGPFVRQNRRAKKPYGSGNTKPSTAWSSVMRRFFFLLFLLFSPLSVAQAGAQPVPTVDAPPILYFPNANARPTYFSIHNIRAAWEQSRGQGVKVGILDHSFGYQVHEGLYTGGRNFQEDDWGESFDSVSHHGYWMARTLREVAPEVQIYALGTYSSDEESKVEAMVQAIDWAIEADLDVLAYSARRFSPELRRRLDEAVDRALAAGITTTFIHYPHPGNLLPSWLGPRSGDDEREPDFNLLHYDYSVVFTERYAEWLEKGEASGYRPFLSVSSTSPVLAGFVAILKALRPELGSEELKRILTDTSRGIEFEGYRSPRTVDIGAAVRSVMEGEGIGGWPGTPGPGPDTNVPG